MCAVSGRLGESQSAAMFVINSASEHSSTHFLNGFGFITCGFFSLPLTLKVLDVVLHSSIKKAKGLLDVKINSAGKRLHICFQFLVCFIYICK